jgi:hypothetical protein
MRFDTPIFFQSIIAGEYNKDTANYEKDTVTEVKKYADVTESLTETLQVVYGELKQGCFTIRLQNPYDKPFSRVRIGAKTYRVDWKRRNRVFVVSEVQ